MSEYSELVKSIEADPEYWAELLISEFTEELARLMDEQRVTRRDLAQRIGSQPSYITKILSGNANFSAGTMAKFADAVDAKVCVHLAPKNATVRWFDVFNTEGTYEGIRSMGLSDGILSTSSRGDEDTKTVASQYA